MILPYIPWNCAFPRNLIKPPTWICKAPFIRSVIKPPTWILISAPPPEVVHDCLLKHEQSSKKVQVGLTAPFSWLHCRWSSKLIDLLFLVRREVSVKPFLNYLQCFHVHLHCIYGLEGKIHKNKVHTSKAMMGLSPKKLWLNNKADDRYFAAA